MGQSYNGVIIENVFYKWVCWLNIEWQERAGLSKKWRKKVRQREPKGWRQERAKWLQHGKRGEILEMKSVIEAKAKSCQIPMPC